MPEWLKFANSWLALPLQVVGFGIAYWQIKKTRKSADAAKNAAKKTQEKIGTNLLLVILPQLTQVETQLEWAVSRGDREATMHYLGAWRWQAGQVRGHLKLEGAWADEFRVCVQSSIAATADTKLSLLDAKADLVKRTKSAQKAIASVTGMLGELSARNSLDEIGDDTNVGQVL